MSKYEMFVVVGADAAGMSAASEVPPAYGGVFIVLAWGILVDGFRPDRYDLLGALTCVVGVLVMVGPHRGPA